jgi:hypothetical protein
MFKSGDVVSKIATGRKGRVVEAGIGGLLKSEVHFLDGKHPPIEETIDPSQWQLEMHLDGDSPPALVPESWIV